MKKPGMNLLFYPRPYKARIEWDEKIVQVIVPFYMDKCGQPPAKKLPRGISSRFANLRDPESYYFAQDFDRFVAEFGFLGITDLPKEHFIIFQPPQYGEHYKENISWWVHYAQDVYILLRLYRVLKRAREHEEYDAEEAIDGLFSMWVKNGAPRMGRVLDDTPLIKVAPRIMARAIACSLTGGINISDMNVVPVSYTHLDVYKRQQLGFASLCSGSGQRIMLLPFRLNPSSCTRSKQLALSLIVSKIFAVNL